MKECCDMKELIRSQLALHGQTQAHLAVWLGHTEKTISKKMNHPEMWTMKELMKMASKWKISVKELIP